MSEDLSRKRLGRGLAALIGDLDKPQAARDEVSVVRADGTAAIEHIAPNPRNPRRTFAEADLEDLTQSIREHGIVQPVVVRRMPNDKFEIIAGERRWRAAQIAGLTEIPAVVREIPDEAAVAIALIENIQRENLNPVEEAMALQRLLEEFSMTHQQVADAIGKSRVTVTNLLRLLTLADEVKTLLEHGDIEMGHARALLTLPEALQCEAAQIIIEKSLSVRDTEELVRRLQLPKLPDLPKSIDPDIKRLQQDLSTRLKMMVAIQCNSKGKGKVVIRYSNLNELDSLLEYFE